MPSERCDRCRNEGSDRRSLWMACFYAMEELRVPFKKSCLILSTNENGKSATRDFYTLRVCKRCRADWMQAIQQWFGDIPSGEDGDADVPEPDTGIGTGIYIRRNGMNVEITREEWDRIQAEKQDAQ